MTRSPVRIRAPCSHRKPLRRRAQVVASGAILSGHRSRSVRTARRIYIFRVHRRQRASAGPRSSALGRGTVRVVAECIERGARMHVTHRLSAMLLWA